MIKKAYFCIGLIAVFLIGAGCAGPSRVAMDYGTSYKLAKFNQTLNPEAEKSLEPVIGLDGAGAKAVIEKYKKDFEKEPPKPVYIIPVGSIGK